MNFYEKNGVFPTSLSTEDGQNFTGPLRCHYRPRSIVPMLMFSLWASFCLPLIFNSLKGLLGTGMMSLLAGIFIFGIGMTKSCIYFQLNIIIKYTSTLY